MICSNCGFNNLEGSNFCSRCGQQITSTVSGDTTTVIPIIQVAEEETPRHPEISEEDALAVDGLSAGKALLIVTRGMAERARFLLDSAVISAGRSPNADILLDDITVSRKHVKFIAQENGFIIEDQGSLNGTYVNRTLVDGSAPLRSGDEVQIGKFRMLFFVSELGMR